MATVVLTLSDDIESVGVILEAHYIDGIDETSHAHIMAIGITKYMDDLSSQKKELNTDVVQGGDTPVYPEEE